MYQVSFIIPIYNVSEYIKTSFLSALKQTFRSIEYILVDDCGTDNSMDVVYTILNNHPRKQDVFIYRHEQNKGLSAARNTGLEKATGNYVFFMDSDDEITEDCIQKHYDALINSAGLFTVANVELIGTKSLHVKDISKDCYEYSPLLSFFKRRWNISAWNKLYLRSFLKENALVFQSGLLHEDILWSYKLCLFADRITFLSDKTYKYIIHEGSITTTRNSSKKIESLLFILREIVEDWNQGKIGHEYLNSYADFLIFWRFNTALLLLNYSGDCSEKRKYYSQINDPTFTQFNKLSLFSTLLRLPFCLFSAVFSPIYSIYKKNK